jgi:hypothetical protein
MKELVSMLQRPPKFLFTDAARLFRA